MPDLRPIDMIREAIKAGHNGSAEVSAYIQEKYHRRFTAAVVGRLIKRVSNEQQRAVGTLLTGQTEDGQTIDPVVAKGLGALIKKHGLPKVRASMEVATWFVG